MAKKQAAHPLAANSDQPLSIAELLRQAKKRSSYPGTQQNLYSYADLAWTNYLAKQPAFAAHSGQFTEELGEDAKDAILAASALPSYEALSDAHLVARNYLIKLLDPVLIRWQSLKGFATDAFDAEDLPSKLRAAGWENYIPASKYSWDSAAELIRMANIFMVTNSAALLANNNMPSAFPAAFAAAGAAFSAQRQVFLLKEKEAREGIAAKFDANEAVYASLVKMTNAGKVIYKHNALERRNFTISRLLNEVRGNSTSGIQGVVTTGTLPAVPVANALLFDRNDPGRFVLTGSDGKFEFAIPSGFAMLRLEAPGFEPQDFERKIAVGTMHR